MQRNGATKGGSDGVVSVNEALARGLRHRIVNDIGVAERASERLIRSTARSCSAPTTRKGARRFFKQQTRIYSRVLVVPPAELVAEQYGVWLCWHVFDEEGLKGHECGEIGVVAHVVDLLSGVARTFPLPPRFRAHLFERTFQRLGTTEPADVLAELRQAALWGVVLGIVLSSVRVMTESGLSAEPLPFMLPTPQGAILGDTLPQWPHLCINTYVGGRRAMTPTKDRLREALQAELADLSAEAMERMLRGYFVGLFGRQSVGGRLGVLRDQSVAACFDVMKRVSGVLQRHRHSLLTKAVRDDDLQRNELIWRWAHLQHRTQCEEAMA